MPSSPISIIAAVLIFGFLFRVGSDAADGFGEMICSFLRKIFSRKDGDR